MSLPCEKCRPQKQAYLASSSIALHLAQFLGFIIAFGSLPMHFLYFVSIAVRHASRLAPIVRFSIVDGDIEDLESRARRDRSLLPLHRREGGESVELTDRSTICKLKKEH